MKYFLDTEFIEGPQKKTFLGVHTGNTKPTIDLISLGLVAEDGREYYAISKDFSLKEAWNRYQMKQVYGDMRNRYPDGVKEYWIRENVLNPIFMEFLILEREYLDKQKRILGWSPYIDAEWSYSNFKRLLKKYGKTNKEIAEEIIIFTTNYSESKTEIWDKPEFYAYYADYDWVVFCWLFGSMMDLPKGFPMYCKDLKQMLDEKAMNQEDKYKDMSRLDAWVQDIKKHKDYPKQTNEHNALDDAKWNHKLYKFLNQL